MLGLLKDYVTVFEEELNTDLMLRTHDKPLVEYVKDSWLSLQIIKGIEIEGFKYTERESEFDINKYILKRTKGLKSKEKFKYKWINDSRVGLLTVYIKLSIEENDPKLGETVIREQKITKSMLIPVKDEDGYYYLGGQKVYLIYQLVEKSTYTAANSVILKSLMPFATRRYTIKTKDTKGNEYVLPYYTIELFHKDVEVMLIYATRGGLNGAIQFSIDYPYIVMNLVEEEDENDLENIYFQISSKLFIRVNRELFDQFVYVKSIVGGILQISTNHLTLKKADEEETWLKKLGANNVQKGENLLRSTKRLMDVTTQSILKVNPFNKYDVQSVIRWMCSEYNDLRAKDNMNLENKRLRDSEIISSLLTYDFSNRLNRLMSYGKKATIETYRELFSFPGDKEIVSKCPRKTTLTAGNLHMWECVHAA